MQLIDTHAHLDMLTNQNNALQTAQSVGVNKIISIGITTLVNLQKINKLKPIYKGIYFSVGVHPHDAKKTNEMFWKELEDLAKLGAVAIGECGLDFLHNFSPRKTQLDAFYRQIDLAYRLKLPLIIHSRNAFNETISILKEQNAGKEGGVFHCFNGSLTIAKQILNMGFMIGISGIITYPKNEMLRNLVREIPKNYLVIETDSPYLTPVPYRGKKNEPAFIIYINKILAEVLKINVEECANITSKNANQLYRLPSI